LRFAFYLLMALLLLPFVLLKDIYPFARMGMFAFPIQKSSLHKKYKLIVHFQDGQQRDFETLFPDPNRIQGILLKADTEDALPSLCDKIASVHAKTPISCFSFQVFSQDTLYETKQIWLEK